ncbi:hypothetical protein CC1G_08853 [Coprinopsis cinerea okayama7|uniref:F-box domain-containing protein n=1 Tax=Coprinopsis cinerea (strain Okayama-7 / 130 / ATCC MYA-4618 / FGSC 9003) TaxID=240176 RepID=A8P6C3_COPC7|nr:hypothetical protein CC1G_08853 [Coprinopsis cinerea okayama7\|eukprot:XP_001839127.2 hypothetical protein CC1G_08853 [Coprinopsis cinerea okayama7\
MPLPTEVETLRDTIARFDARIQALETELQELKDATSKAGGKQGLGWAVRIAHVCSRWRTVALDCSTLWGYLSSSQSPEWLDAMISRSKESPLSIHVDVPSHHTQATRISQSKLRKILKQTHRLQHISLTSGPLRLHAMLKGLVAPLPLLETATIVSVNPYSSNIDLDDERYAYSDARSSAIPDGIFGKGVPKLQTLSFIGCIPSFGTSPPHFPTLTNFSIVSAKIDGDDCPPLQMSPLTFNQLILAVSMMPALQSLDIGWPEFRRSPENLPFVSAPIPLPHLNHLRLEVPCQHAANFLSQLHLPGSMVLVLECRNTYEDSLLHLGRALASSWISLPLSSPQSPFSQLPIDQLDIAYASGVPKFHISGSAVQSAPDQEKIVASFSMTFAASWSWSAPLTRLALSPWPTTQVESLSIFQQRKDITIIREVLLKPFPSVYTVDVEGQAVEYLRSYLRSDPALNMAPELPRSESPRLQTAPSSSKEAIQPRRRPHHLPNLAELSISNSWMTLHSKEGDTQWFYDYLESIGELLERRAALGSSLDLLRVLRCTAPPAGEVEKLKRVVARVEFWPDVPEPVWHEGADAYGQSWDAL